MLIAEVRLYGIGNFAEETVIELAPETFFCGSADARKTFRRAMKLLFGNTSPAPQDFSATEMRISAKLTFPETDSAEIPEFFHHMRAEDDGEICAVLELSAKAADGEIETQHSWLLPHDIRRQVKSDEAPAVKFIRIAPDGMTLKEAFLRILPDILLMDEKIELPAFPEIASLIESAKHLPADCTKWLLDGIGMIAETEQMPALLRELLTIRQNTPNASNLLLYIGDMPDFTIEANKTEIIYSSAQLPAKDFQTGQIRCFTGNSVHSIKFPANPVDKICVAGGIKNFPELLTAAMVIFTVSADDKIILEKFLKLSGIDLSDRNIAIVPLSGRQVHLYWQILDQLDTPYFTLADLQHGKSGGDWAAIAGYLHSCAYCNRELPVIEGQNTAVDIEEVAKDIPDLKNENVWMDWLRENQNIFFAAPYDLNHLMFHSFRQEYGGMFPEYSENDEEFYRQLCSRRDFSRIYSEIFSILSDDELKRRMPDMIRLLICQIK
ncbi:MAG: hypothetical protein IJC27_01380 [Lentisphaeria bacterium]|nr:hypothetical protein [Lentisphaeria bacterium]